MKKLLSGVLVLLTVAAAAFFFLKARRYLPERPRAAELAPSETILFAQIPNLRNSVLRFQKTGLCAIWQEPEVQAFLEKPRQKAPQMKHWDTTVTLLTRVAPGEVFVAVTSIDGPQPRFVAGFSYAGSRGDAEALLVEPRANFKRRWPAGTSNVESHKAAAIETFTYAQGMLAECFVHNWYFVASDAMLLRATLDRYEAPTSETAGTLAANEVFQKATAPLGAGLDTLLFGQLTTLGERLGTLMAITGKQPVAQQQEESSGRKTQAIAAGTKIEGGQMRDRLFVLGPGAAHPEPLTRRTLALSGPETFLYYAAETASLARIPDSSTALAAALPGFAALEQALAARGLKWGDFTEAFGPELGTTLEWPGEAVAPTVLLALEVRDPARARDFIEVFTGGALGSAAWTRREEPGVSHYAAPVGGLTLATPMIALTPRFALVGLSADAIAVGLQRAQTPATGLAASAGYQQAASLVTPPTAAFGYLDAGALFERTYRMLRPVITMALAFSEDAGNYLDAGRLPSAQTISKHLTPSVLSQSAVENGTLLESTGTLTFNQILIGIVGGTVAAALPTLENAMADGLKTGSTPQPAGASAAEPEPSSESSAPAPPAPDARPVPEIPGPAETQAQPPGRP